MESANSGQETEKEAQIKKTVESFDLHLGRLALKNMAKNSKMIFQTNITTGHTDTNESLRLRGIRLAQELTNRKIGLRDVVMICGVNSDYVTIPVVSCMFLGCAVLPLPATMVYGELKAMVTMGLPKIIFSDLEIAPLFKKILHDLEMDIEVIILGESPDNEFTPLTALMKPTGTEEDFKAIDYEPSTTAFIVCSSGTTGLPKGICLSHKGLIVNLFLVSAAQPPNVEFRTFVASNLFWLSGVFGYLNSMVKGTNRLYSPLPCTAEMTFDVIDRFQPKLVMVSPMVVSQILNHPDLEKKDFTHIQMFAAIGSALPYNKLLILQNKMPNGCVFNTYGMTETCGVACGSKKLVPNSCGSFLPWVKYKIVNPDTNETLGPNQTGELCLKSDYTLFTGYYRNPEATAQAFDKDKWFHTGDLMYFDDDKNFYFVDRIKEMFKYQNCQVVPCELEDVIRRLPGIQDVCVVGIKQGDVDDYAPRAFVQLVAGSKITVDDVKNVVKENLSDYKQLREGVVFMDKLPTTYSGKIDRKTINKIKTTFSAN